MVGIRSRDSDYPRDGDNPSYGYHSVYGKHPVDGDCPMRGPALGISCYIVQCHIVSNDDGIVNKTSLMLT